MTQLHKDDTRKVTGGGATSLDHLLIEGDNLYSLQSLQDTHTEQVDIIPHPIATETSSLQPVCCSPVR